MQDGLYLDPKNAGQAAAHGAVFYGIMVWSKMATAAVREVIEMPPKFVLLTYVVSREGQYYVSRCNELGTSSFGDSEQEAVDRLTEASELYLNTLEELGICQQVLTEKGVPIREFGPVEQRVSCPPGANHVLTALLPLSTSATA